ncbi:MAG: sugar phosphate isomerase/epimerase [bacterium]|nr:sugar phosphate isomerase/epimerase [bacterium]
MGSVVACNLNSYLQYQETAYEHLAQIGLTYVEIHCPEPSDVGSVQKALAEYGLQASSLIVPCQMDADDVVLRFSKALDVVTEMGVSYVFTSAKTGEIDPEYVYGRLQNIGDAAAERGIVVVLETHPDLVTNGDVARETMAGVAHPNVQINFDTANLYYYNRNITATGELAKVIDHVASVHLKDTDGGFESWHFPALGEGVVDFPEIFSMLFERGFDGPFTLELEGIQGETIDRQGVEKRIEDSLAYLKTCGMMD